MKISFLQQRLLILLMVLSAWLTILLGLGAIIMPILFSMLSKHEAGRIAAKLFQVEAWLTLSLSLGLIYWVLRYRLSESWRRLLVLLGAILLCTLCGYFVLQPAIAALRVLREAQPENITLIQRFAWMHGLSSAFYWLKVVLLSVFIWRVWRSFSKVDLSQTVQRVF